MRIDTAAILISFVIVQSTIKAEDSHMKNFDRLNNVEWKQVFHDPCANPKPAQKPKLNEDWKERWSLDGQNRQRGEHGQGNETHRRTSKLERRPSYGDMD